MYVFDCIDTVLLMLNHFSGGHPEVANNQSAVRYVLADGLRIDSATKSAGMVLE